MGVGLSPKHLTPGVHHLDPAFQIERLVVNTANAIGRDVNNLAVDPIIVPSFLINDDAS